MIGKCLGGCGCLMLMLVLLIAAFLAGTHYGPQTKQKLNDCCGKPLATIQGWMGDVDRQVQKAQRAADALADRPEPDSRQTNQNNSSSSRK